jgi:hypothetical protein
VSKFTNLFKDIGSAVKNAAEDFKAAVVKVANDAPGVLATIEKDAPEVEALSALAFPSAPAIEQGGISLLEEVASVLKQGGSAAEASFLSAGLDQSTINGVKSLIPAFEQYLATAKKA